MGEGRQKQLAVGPKVGIGKGKIVLTTDNFNLVIAARILGRLWVVFKSIGRHSTPFRRGEERNIDQVSHTKVFFNFPGDGRH